MPGNTANAATNAEFGQSQSRPEIPDIHWPSVLSPDATRIPGSANIPAAPPRRWSVFAAALAAAFVFVAVLAVGGLEFRSVARFRLDPDLSEADVAAVRLRLLDFLLNVPQSGQSPSASAWMVQANEGFLRFAAGGATPRQSAELAKRLADQFAAAVEFDAKALEATPSPAEVFVGESLELHRSRTHETGRRLTEARTQLPAVDPRATQAELLQRWRQKKDDLQTAADALRTADARLTELRGSEPITVAADPSDIANAELANLGLQQDMKEMNVNLAEVRSELLRADDAVQVPFENAANAAANLRYQADDAALNHPELPSASDIAIRAAEYASRLSSLQSDWAARAGSLRRAPDDLPPQVLIDAQETLAKLAGDFTYAADPMIREIDKLATDLADSRTGRGQHRELISSLVRDAQVLAAEHRRVAFAVAGVTIADNFRLDAALRAGRALHARCRAIRQVIADQLAATALAEARTAWSSALASAETAVADTRADHDRAVRELLAVHEELIESFRGAAGYVELLTRADIDDDALRTGQQDLRRIEQQLDSLMQARLAAARSPISPAGVEIDPWPVNIVPRLYTAGTAAIATLIAMLMGQFWLTRRSDPNRGR